MASAMPGGCLCGAVRFAATPRDMHMDVCHCSMCRRWSGGTFMAVDCSGSLAVEDETALRVYGSSDYGERVFCGTCGSSLFWRMKDGSMTFVSAQAFDDPSGLPLKTEIFIDRKPPTYDFAGPTTRMTEAEFIAAMSAGAPSGTATSGSNANG